MIDIDDFKHEIECIYKDDTLSEIMELFSGILVMVNGLVNMITSGLSGKPMINTDTWRLPPFVFILS